MTEKLRHWQYSIDDDSVARLLMDSAEKSVNLLSFEMMAEFAVIAKDLQKNAKTLKGVILRSNKSSGFAYGADIYGFETFKNTQETMTHLDAVHRSLAMIADLPCLTAAGIDGLALGGGLEIALPFDTIIATDSVKTQLAFPEVTLGLLPGYGGTARGFARTGMRFALDMMISGRMVSAQEAWKNGLVDALAESHDTLLLALEAAIRHGKNAPRHPKLSDDAQSLFETQKRIQRKYRPDHHRAVFAICQHFADNIPDEAKILQSEKTTFAELLMGENSRNLRRVYRLNDRLKKQARGDAKIQRVHIIGAGVMGGDIAAVAALRGFTVHLQDWDEAAIESAQKRAEQYFARKLKNPDSAKLAAARLMADKTGEHIGDADIIIEAVAESLPIKQEIFQEAAKKAKPDTIFASNTSAIPLEDIATKLPQADRLIGLHFFNPALVLPLVEIIRTQHTSDDALKRALAFAGALKKLPVLCQSRPGFLVNRALFPYIFSALEEFLAGENPDKIDESLLDFGMPMGPIELADQVGLDICLHIGAGLGGSDAVKAALQTKIDAGLMGRKSAEGFYRWTDKKAERPRGDYDKAEMNALAQKFLHPMIAECQKAVDEGAVEDADIADAAMLFGVGFPAHTGGPLYYKRAARRFYI